MTHLLIVILDDVKTMPSLLQAWSEAGVPGATILQSAGAYRATTWLSRVGLGALDRLFESDEVRRRTVLTVIDDDALLESAIAEAERVVGGFDRPNSGLLVALPVAQVRGLRKVQPRPAQALLPPAVRPGWTLQRDTPMAEVVERMRLEPTIVRGDATLDEVAQAMQANPSVHVACVVSADGRLIGLLPLRPLADDLFFHIMPEEFLSESFNLSHAIDYAKKSRMRTAADAMQKATWVKPSDKLKDAFKRMHDHQLTGLPVVDDSYRVIGYVNLLELLAACTAPTMTADEEAGPA